MQQMQMIIVIRHRNNVIGGVALHCSGDNDEQSPMNIPWLVTGNGTEMSLATGNLDRINI